MTDIEHSNCPWGSTAEAAARSVEKTRETLQEIKVSLAELHGKVDYQARSLNGGEMGIPARLLRVEKGLVRQKGLLAGIGTTAGLAASFFVAWLKSEFHK